MADQRPRVFTRRPEDHGWEAFRDWISETFTAITGKDIRHRQ